MMAVANEVKERVEPDEEVIEVVEEEKIKEL